jgi:hypothetical protein
MTFRVPGLSVLVMLSFTALLPAQERGPAWTRHTIDASSRGADGTRLADVNGDGLPDIATGWEQGNEIRVYLNPGPARAKAAWPAVTVGKVGAPEDAVFVDLDRDGATDVISCCEGKVRSVYVHWAPKDRTEYLKASAWKTEAFPALQDRASWMFCLPLQIDGRHGPDLVLGAKTGNSEIGWLEAPEHPRDLAAWRWHSLYRAGWIMSLVPDDVDGDGDLDIVASDRKGSTRGCLWLENPGPARATQAWTVHRIGPTDHEVMFLDVVDLDRDGSRDVVVATRDNGLLFLRRKPGPPIAWETHVIKLPPSTGTGKAVRAADVDGDGKLDLVFSCESAAGAKSGVVWLSWRKAVTEADWEAHEVSGPEGVKYDLVELLDLDGDGDLDVLTCEESQNMGVFWYENPTRRP